MLQELLKMERKLQKAYPTDYNYGKLIIETC